LIAPENCLAFDGIVVAGILGKIAATTSSTSTTATTMSLGILEFDATATSENGFDIMPAWGVSLTQICLNIHYENKETIGYITCFLPAQKMGGVLLTCKVDADMKEVYTINLKLLEGAVDQPDATDIFNTFLQQDQWKVPAGLGLPAAFPLAELHVVVTRGESADIWGFDGDAELSWGPIASGVTLTSSLGGRVRLY
jgi:hypothetical protein